MPMRSSWSAGFRFSNVFPEAAGTQAPRDVVADAVSCRLPDGVAAELRRRGFLASSLRPDMSLLPRNIAPSAITILGARMLPVSLPVAWISTR